ncbi:MAG: metallophosphoesterase [Isosphaeraceae bacterium]|nr:metallophosphoesterase [Isosphaeraceae bacterium]
MVHIPFGLVVIGSTVADGLLAGTSLHLVRRRAECAGHRDLSLLHILRAASATCLAISAKLLILRAVGVKEFGVIHLVYVDLTVLLPVTGLLLLVLSQRAWRERTPWKLTALARASAAASLIMVPVGVYASWIEPFRLQVESVRAVVAPRREGKSTIRVGVLSDLQTGRVTDYERLAVATLMAQAPDVIVLPGDVFQGKRQEFDATRYDLKDLLERLSAPGGVYLVLGDTDGDGAHLDEILRASRVQVLRNEIVRTEVRDRRVTIGGVALKVSSPGARAVVAQLEQAPGDDDVRILVSHRPDSVFELCTGSRIDLVIAGHTHGGQIVVPGYGPPLTLTNVPRAVAAGGLHRVGGNAIYVSRGVGCERGQAPRIRFLCPPEISLVELSARGGS